MSVAGPEQFANPWIKTPTPFLMAVVSENVYIAALMEGGTLKAT